MNRSRMTATVLAALSLFAAFPGAPFELAPAVAEAETTGPLFMENLGWGLPLKIDSVDSGPARLLFDGTPDEKDLPMARALERYSAEDARASEELLRDLRVRRADRRAVSFLESRVSYPAQKRARCTIHGKTFDTATGRALSFDDVFTDRVQLANEIAYRLSIIYPGRFPSSSLGNSEYDAFAEKVGRVMENDEFAWSLDPFGATFYFNPGTLTSDPCGDISTVTFCFAYTPYHFRPAYRSCPESFCMETEPGLPTVLCFDEQPDMPTEITIGPETAPGVVIRRNGTEFFDPGEVLNVRPVFVMTDDRRKYLYIDCSMAALNPMHELRVYDLCGDEIRRVECDSHFTMLATEPSDEKHRAWHVMTDPEDFVLTRTDTPFLEDFVHCRVGADGSPVIIGTLSARP